MRKRAIKRKRSPFTKKNIIIVLITAFSAVGILLSLVIIQNSQDDTTITHAQSASGWLSGASCKVTDGTFASWRGSPVTVAGTWNDNSVDSQREQWSMANEYGKWNESIDVSIGGFWGTTWTDVANGAIDDNLHSALSAIDKGWGSKKTVFIRFAHEFNGSWYKWKVTPADNEAYKKAFARFYTMVQTDLVAKGRDAKVVWSPNSDEHNGVNTKDSWPGDQYVDIVGVDYYDWDRASTQSKWDEVFNKSGKSGGPAGIGAWQAFAKSHGKPISFPEWGTTGDGPYDNPFFIQKMNEFFRTNAGTGPGQVWYEIYFDCTGYDNGGGENFLIFPEASSKVPKSAAMYKSLKWGDGGISVLPPAVTVQPTSIVPTYACIGNPSCGASPTPAIAKGYQSIPVTAAVTQAVEQPETEPIITASPDKSNGGGGGGGNESRGSRGGFFQSIMAFFQSLIALFLQLIGAKS